MKTLCLLFCGHFLILIKDLFNQEQTYHPVSSI